MSPSNANVEAMVRAGIEAARSKNREEAYRLLLKATELDENNETAWLWLAGVVDSPEDQQTCLENVLTINPYNEKARKGLEALAAKTSPLSAPPDPPPAPTQPSAPPADSPDETEDELPTSVAWDMPIPSSSPSQYSPIEEPTPADYDDWVVGLNLKNSVEDMTSTPDAIAPPSPMPFVGDENLFGFAEDDEDSTMPPDQPDSLAALRAEVFADGPFETEFEDDHLYMDAEPEPPPAAPPPLSVAPSPAFTYDLKEQDILKGFETDDYPVDMLDSYDDAELTDVDPDVYFMSIPEEIRASRLPGTIERHHPLLLIALLALVALNIGAVYLVVTTLTSG